MTPAMPSMSLQTSASSSAKGGEFGVSGNVLLNQGDWIVTTGSGKASGGTISENMIYVAAGALALWAILKFKKKA